MQKEMQGSLSKQTYGPGYQVKIVRKDLAIEEKQRK
jgi:hypothetical protein